MLVPVIVHCPPMHVKLPRPSLELSYFNDVVLVKFNQVNQNVKLYRFIVSIIVDVVLIINGLCCC